jgi:hypothetical protein
MVTDDGPRSVRLLGADDKTLQRDRPLSGFFYGAEWRLGRRALLTTLKNDNHADPLTLKNGHYGFESYFALLTKPHERHRWSVSVEWLKVNVARPSLSYFARQATVSDEILRLGIRYRVRSSQQN